MRPSAITPEHLISANRSINLEMQTWANRGVTLFAVLQAAIPLVTGTANYSLPLNLVQVLDTFYSYPDGTGGNTDRILVPMTRTEYAEIPNKATLAPPTRYWFDRTATPSVTLWPVPDGSVASSTMSYFYLRQLQDANTSGAETPDILNRFYEALISGLAKRLAEKYAPERFAEKTALASIAWEEAAAEDREQGPLVIRPRFARYYGRR